MSNITQFLVFQKFYKLLIINNKIISGTCKCMQGGIAWVLCFHNHLICPASYEKDAMVLASKQN